MEIITERLARARKCCSISMLFFLALTACAAERQCEIGTTGETEAALDGGETLEALRKRGTLKVGFSSFFPWAMQDVNEKWIGFELDVIHKLTRDFDLEPVLVPRPWGGIIDDLLNGEFDIIISGMSVTPQRAERVTFSIPYEFNKTVLMLNRGIQATSLKELNQPQYLFVGRAGSTSLALTGFLFHKVQIQSFEVAEYEQLLQALTSGRAAGFLTPSVDAAVLLESYPDSIYIPDWGQELVKEDAAFTLPKNVEPAWLDYLNQWIEKNWANGFLEEKTRYWLESSDWRNDHEVPES